MGILTPNEAELQVIREVRVRAARIIMNQKKRELPVSSTEFETMMLHDEMQLGTSKEGGPVQVWFWGLELKLTSARLN